MPSVTPFGSSFASGVEGLGFDSYHRRDGQLFPDVIADPQGQIPDLGLGQDKIEYVNVSALLAGTITSQTITLAVLAGGGDVYIAAGKTDFTNTETGFILGIDDSDNDEAKFSIGNATSYLDWNITTADTLTIAGSITASSGSIGGFDIGTDYIRDAANSFGLASTVTGGDDVRFWAGDTFANRATADFFITESGAITATSATITGVITVNTGYLGGTSGWVVSANTITDVAGVVGLSSAVTAGDDIRFWAGDTTPASAEFYVTESGALVASSATITGSITATSGDIGGWVVTSGYIYNLQSGTPTVAPSDGISMASGNEAITVYEDTETRVILGYLSAGVYGLRVYATDGATTIFEASDTQQMLAGWNFTSTVLRSGATDAASNVLIDSANSLFRLGPTTGDYITLDGANLRLRSSNYVSGALGAGFTLEPDLFEVGNASIRGRLQMATFVANSISAVNGDLMVTLGSDVLTADMTALDAATVTIDGDMTLAVNDIIRIKEGVNDEWMLVTNIASAPTYTVTRDVGAAYGANANPAWTTGATVVNFGPSGSGGLFLTASDTNAPFMSVFTHAGAPYTTMTTRLRAGNLNGYLGYVADIYGLGVGSSSAGEANITIEPTNGLRIRSGTTTLIQFDMAGGANISGWNLVDGYIYNLQSGTPTAAPSDGVVLASGNEGLLIYEDTELRIRLGYLSAGVYGLVGYATDGTTKLFELSDTQNMISGWVLTDGYIYNLQSGTPTSSPNDGVVLASGNEALIIYEDTAVRVQVGYLSAGVYGVVGYATDGSTKIFEMSDTQQFVGGWTFTEASLYNLASGTPTASPNDGLVLTANATPSVIAYEDTAIRARLGYLSAGVFGFVGYATDGTTKIFEMSDTQQMVAGWVFDNTYMYGLVSGTPTASPNDGTVLVSGSTGGLLVYEDTALRVRVGYLSAGIYGILGYATDGSTKIFEMSDTQQMVAGWNFTNTVFRSGATDAASNVLIDSANSLMRLGPTTGNYITLDGANLRIRSSNYVSGVMGDGFTLEPDLLEVGNVTARGLIRSAVFQSVAISAIGGNLLVADADKLDADMTALDASTLTISGNTTFAVNDILRIKNGTDDEWLLVTNIASAPTYTVTRDQAAAYAADTNPVWTNGASVVNYGASGEGLVYMTASDTNAPYIAVLTHAGSPWSTTTTRARLGNLNGYLGYAADIYGLGVGSSSAGEANITIEPTNGIRIRTGTTVLFQVDMAGSATIGGWVLGATSLTDAAGVVGISSAVTGGDDIRFFAGDATPGSAEFRVYESGALVASSATITGSVTATSGAIGGWTINATSITDAAGVVGLSSAVTGGDDIRIWAGDATPGSAEFRVTEAGALTATSATITGAITASSGSITGGFSVLAGLTVGTAGSFSSGQTAYDTGTGWWMEYNAGTPRFSLGNSAGDNLTWDGTTLDITGSLTADSGSIGGFDIGTDYIRDAANSFGLASTVTGGDDVRFWAGDTFANRATADFRVTEAGAVTATSITLSTNVVLSGLQAGSSVDGTYLAALSVGTASIANLAVTDAKIDTLAVSKLTAGTITSKSIVLAVSDTTGDVEIRAGIATGDFANTGAATGFILGIDDSDSNLAKFYVGDGTNEIEFNGTTFAVNGVTIDGTSTANGSTVENVQTRAEALFTEDLMYVGRPDDSDTALTEFITSTGGGSITRYLMHSSLLSGAGPGAASRLVGSGVMATLDGATVQWQDKDLEFYVNADFTTAGTQDAFLGFFARGSLPAANATDTTRHIGFYFQDGTIYASNADGTTQTRTDVSSGITMTNFNLYWFKWDAGTNILYYINDTLVATHSTNLPTTSDGVPLIYIDGDGTAARRLDVKNNYTFIMKTP